MPELPEVQTVVNSLQIITHKSLKSFSSLGNKVSYNCSTDYIKQHTKNSEIESITRLGKYIVIKTNKSYLAFHLRMTGYLYYCKDMPKNKKYMRCSFKFTDGTFLIFEDIRKFGGFYYLRSLTQIINKLGIDPFDKNFTSSWISKNFYKKNRQIKSILLDQGVICGLGNIYIDEILWKSRIHPKRITSTINQKKIQLLHNNIISILNESIEHHGTTIMNFRFDNMKTGNYKKQLNVYGRENKICNSCFNLIIKIKSSGRGTYLCPTCQT